MLTFPEMAALKIETHAQAFLVPVSVAAVAKIGPEPPAFLIDLQKENNQISPKEVRVGIY